MNTIVDRLADRILPASHGPETNDLLHAIIMHLKEIYSVGVVWHFDDTKPSGFLCLSY